jgi:hypothetical protein
MDFKGIDNPDHWLRAKISFYFYENYLWEIWGDFIAGKTNDGILAPYQNADHLLQ